MQLFLLRFNNNTRETFLIWSLLLVDGFSVSANEILRNLIREIFCLSTLPFKEGKLLC
jgi:hypothetical protein